MTKLPFEIGAMHYDDPPPDQIDDLEPLRAAGRFRFANRLAAWIDVEDGRITGHGYTGGGVMGSTLLSLGVPVTFAAIGLPDITASPSSSTTGCDSRRPRVGARRSRRRGTSTIRPSSSSRDRRCGPRSNW